MMKVAGVALMAVVGAVFGGRAVADEALAKSKGCMVCHAIDKRLLGPSYKDVAARYKDDPAAADKLAVKVRSGGKGIWGEIPMPPNPVSDEEAKKLVSWVLAQ